MNKIKYELCGGKLTFLLLICFGFLLFIGTVSAAAKPKLLVTKAGLSANKNQLVIKGAIKQGAPTSPIVNFDLNGRRLTQISTNPFALTLDSRELPSAPCAVRVQTGNLETIKKVIGAPKSCLKAPTCQILSPIHAEVLKANERVGFEAKAALKDKQAGNLKAEWDFAGGAMQTDAQRMDLLNGNSLKTESESRYFC